MELAVFILAVQTEAHVVSILLFLLFYVGVKIGTSHQVRDTGKVFENRVILYLREKE
jgi:hypothetical protein